VDCIRGNVSLEAITPVGHSKGFFPQYRLQGDNRKDEDHNKRNNNDTMMDVDQKTLSSSGIKILLDRRTMEAYHWPELSACLPPD
jgi:hypothetical protein